MNDSGNNEHFAVEQLIKDAGSDKAPQGFTEGVMSRINAEPVNANPISLPFRIGSFVVFAVLIIVGIISYGDESSGLLPGIAEWFDSLKGMFANLSLPHFQGIGKFQILIYIFPGLLLLLFFDGLFVRFSRSNLGN